MLNLMCVYVVCVFVLPYNYGSAVQRQPSHLTFICGLCYLQIMRSEVTRSHNSHHAIQWHVISIRYLSDSRDNVISGGRESGVGISSFVVRNPYCKVENSGVGIPGGNNPLWNYIQL